MPGQKTLIHLRQWFGIEIGSSDVEHVFEILVNFELLHHRVRVLAGAVGENELALWSFSSAAPSAGFGSSGE
jgi:hypothetical protein